MAAELDEKSEHTRKSLINKKMGFNQMRNGLYWLQRVMKQFELSDQEITQKLKAMGTNIGATYSMALELPPTDVESSIKEIYKKTLNSKVNVTQKGDYYYIEDKKCALCKYQYEDINIPGCTIAAAMVSEILTRKGLNIKSAEVVESKALGHKTCIHEFILKPGEN
jgi:predicted hydrocarbon binding protein